MENYDLYFYKGTCWAPLHIPLSGCMQAGKEQIELGLRISGMSLDEQAKLYFEQLDQIENCLCKHAPFHMDRKTERRVSKALNMSTDKIYMTWCINICSLLIMKKLQNDDMNGHQRFMTGLSSKKNATISMYADGVRQHWKS